MRKIVSGLLITVFLFVGLPGLLAEYFSPEGYWQTVDDETDEIESVVKLWIENGSLKGRIVKLYPKPGEDPDPLCDKCPGEKKDKRILGMVFLWGFERDGDRWVDGKILDPDNGKTYHCQLEVIDGGRRLDVFGYIKIIFKIGRSQTWLRTDASELEK